MKIKSGNDKIIIDGVQKSSGIFGLMFKNKHTNALLFETTSPIHSYFVFFPFLCLWLNNEDKVVDWKIVKPFSFYEKSRKQFSKILEIPINRRYHSIVNFIVGERFKNMV